MNEFIHSSTFRVHVKELLLQHHIPGLSIAVIDNHRIASAGFGYASLPSQTCTPDTLFDVASCSKSLTAAAVALLIEDHADLKYDARAHNVFPAGEFVMSSEDHTRHVTIDDMLGHRTGMAPNDDSLMGVNASTPDDARSVTLKLQYLPVAAPVRSRYLYNNLMYTVLTYLIECRSAQTFASFLSDRIFTPLDMNDTCLQPSQAKRELALGHIWDKDRKRIRAIRARDCPEGQGAGSVISSANDMIKWVRELLDRQGPVSERLYSELIRLRTFINPYPNRGSKKHVSPTFYAAGLDIYWYRGYMIAGHNGVASGFATRFIFMPECSFGLVVLANSDMATGVCTMLTQLLIEEVLHVPDADRTQKMRKAAKRRNHEQLNSSVARERNKVAEPHSALYTGCYKHPSYGRIEVQIKQGDLFINATDRSNAFTAVLESSEESLTHFTAHVSDWYEYLQPDLVVNEGTIVVDEDLEAEFEFIEDGSVSRSPLIAARMGLRLESAIKELIWLDRIT